LVKQEAFEALDGPHWQGALSFCLLGWGGLNLAHPLPHTGWEKSAGYPPDTLGVSGVETAKGPNTGALVLWSPRAEESAVSLVGHLEMNL